MPDEEVSPALPFDENSKIVLDFELVYTAKDLEEMEWQRQVCLRLVKSGAVPVQ